MKRVGIVTHYYESTNYGGNLQAYALVKYLRNIGYDAQQICYKFLNEENKQNFTSLINDFFSNPFKTVYVMARKIAGSIIRIVNHNKIKIKNKIASKKREAFVDFNLNAIKHTEKVYYDNTISDTNELFDLFITGSDQVFNGINNKPFYLTFTAKPKMSYAASMASDTIPKNRIQFLQEVLKDFKAVSVREEKTVELLENIQINSVLTLDPTLLLTSTDYDEVASDRLIKDNYVFCYFLGNNRTERKLASEFARKNSLTLVSIPMATTRYNYLDMEYGDINLPYATPNDFISLVKYANYIFTDSYHASIFSIVYNKQFVVFNVDSKGSMNSRIISLVKLFQIEDRFLNKDESLVRINNALSLDVAYKSEEFKELKAKSIEFLKNNLIN